MKLLPVFEHLTNYERLDFGFEHYFKSNKAMIIANVIDKRYKKSITYGFLFHEVRLSSEIAKNDPNAKKINCEDPGMLYFLYSHKMKDGFQRFVTHNYNNFIIIEAKDVELVSGLDYIA